MTNLNPITASRLALFAAVGALGLGVAWPLAGTAQDKPDQHKDHSKHVQSDKAAGTVKDLAAQIADLRAKVAKLEAALEKSHQGKSGMGMMTGKGGMGMGMMGGEMMDGMGGKGMGMMGGMSDKGMAGMGGKGMAMEDDDGEMMGMMGMSKSGMKAMKGMGKMQMTAALPGFPGASHIYHIGAAGFFLDHPDHITLTTKQQTALNSIKQKALLDKSTSQRKIDEAEQDLWELTASDKPNASKIETKIREIEKLRGDQRMAFIRAVGQAAKVLTDEQRQVLLGLVQPKADKPDPHAGH
jgi:hypothetical protein